MSKTRLRKHTLNPRDGDFEFLIDRFPKSGAGVVIRTLVSRLVDSVKDELTDIPTTFEQLDQPEIHLD